MNLKTEKKNIFINNKQIIIISIFFLSGLVLDGFKNYFYAFLFFLISVFFAYYKNIRIKFDSFLFLIISIFLSDLFSVYFFDSFASFITWLNCAIFYYYINSLDEAQSAMFFKNLKKFFIYFCVLVSIWAVICFFINHNFYFIGENPNYASLFITLAMFCCFLEYNDKKKKVYLLLFIPLSLSLLILNSRAAYISLIISFIIFYNKNKFRIFIYFFTFILLLFLISHKAMYYLFKLDDPKAYYRIDIWISSFKAFISSPFLGYGSNSFEYVFEKFKFPFFDGLSYYNHSTFHSHNELLNIAVENGILSLILYLSVIYKGFIYKKRDFLYFSFIIITIFSLFDIVLRVPFIKIFYFIVISGLSRENVKFIKFREVSFLFILIILAAISLYFDEKSEFKNYKKTYSQISSYNRYRNSAISEYMSYEYPLNPIFPFENAKFYYVSGALDSAYDMAQKSLSIEPYFNNALLMVSDIEIKKGDMEKAYFYFNRINFKSENYNFYSRYISDINPFIYAKIKNRLKGER